MRILPLILLIAAAPVAHAEMWKCVDPNGITPPRYTNVKSEAKGCTALHLDPIITVPATRPQQKPANFPSIGSFTQKQRDADRRKILELELLQEQQQLELAKKQLFEQKETRSDNEKNSARAEERLKPIEGRVRLHENNIESLRKEIANIR